MTAGRPAFLREGPDGVTLAVRVVPRARRDRIEGTVADADGASALKIAVTAPPEDGRANDAVIALLAKVWRIPKSRFCVVQGAAARRKVLHIAGVPAEIAAAIGRAAPADG